MAYSMSWDTLGVCATQGRIGSSALPTFPELRRKVIDVLTAVRVTMADCGSAGHPVADLLAEDGSRVTALAQRVSGLVAARDVMGPDGVLLFAAGRKITRRALAAIGYHWADYVREVPVRSPWTCLATRGVCAMCYPAALDAPVGAAAARAIVDAFAAVRRGRHRAEALPILLRAFSLARPARPSVLAAATGPVRYGRLWRGRVEVFAGDTPCGRIRYEPASFWMPREGQRVDAGEILEWGEEEWLADVRRVAGEAAFHERFLARTQYWFCRAGARVRERDLELWSRQLGPRGLGHRERCRSEEAT